MAGDGDESVVVVGADGHDVGADVAQYAVQRAVGRWARSDRSGSAPTCCREEVGARAREAAQLRSGHRVSAEEARVGDAGTMDPLTPATSVTMTAAIDGRLEYRRRHAPRRRRPASR